MTGNYFARRRFLVLKRLLEFAGVEEGRVQFSWVSASEGQKFADVVSSVTERVRELGPATRFVKKKWELPQEVARQLEEV